MIPFQFSHEHTSCFHQSYLLSSLPYNLFDYLALWNWIITGILMSGMILLYFTMSFINAKTLKG